MFTPAFSFPAPAFCQVEQWSTEAERITVTVRSQQATALCPCCGRASRRRQSHYRRQLADLPWCGVAVRVTLQVRRFYCDNPDCERAVFTERLSELAQPYARRTARLQQAIWWLGYLLGGEAGARLARQLAIPLSPDTLLRCLRQTPVPALPVPRALGIDDWAYRRGHHYGTILVDLESQRPLELLPDRTADTLMKWLQVHPGVTVISRDRAGAYADGARRGAPQALQIADRWHLLKNLREAVERLISRHYPLVKQLAEEQIADLSTRSATSPSAQPSPQPLLLPPPATLPPRLLLPPPAPSPVPSRQPPSRSSRATAQPQRLARYQQVHALHHQGQPLLQIAHQLRMARKTVRRYLQASTFPGRAPRPPGCRQIDRFLPYLKQRWQAGCQIATTLWRELIAKGFTGSFNTVARAVRPWRLMAPHGTPTVSPSPQPPSPRQVSWWLLAWSLPKKNPAVMVTTSTPVASHRLDRHAFIQALCERCPALQQAQRLGNAFIAMVREHRAQDLDAWVTAVLASSLVELVGFVSGILADKAAVMAALSLPWSNGQTEGQINRLKLIKRQMYGRAKLDLLRTRVLHPP